jgi:hypothetical protein
VFRENKIAVYILLILLLSIILSCAGAKRVPSDIPPEGLAAPSNLSADPNDQRVDLKWYTNRTGDMMISGYNIYISEVPLPEAGFPSKDSGLDPFNQIPYPGDADPETLFETFTANELTNGVRYYIAITTVYPDRTESMFSNVEEIFCYPRGILTLKDRSIGDMHGFSFDKLKHVDYNDIENDLYFVARDAGNIIGSPDRNEGVLKHTEFAGLGRKPLNNSLNYKNLNFKDKTFIAEDNVYLIKLEDGSFVKILVKRVDSSQYLKQITFEYIYFEK